jgi:hypothetical protein
VPPPPGLGGCPHPPSSVAVFFEWQEAQAGCQFSWSQKSACCSSCVLPLRQGVPWSATVAFPVHPGRRIAQAGWCSRKVRLALRHLEP